MSNRIDIDAVRAAARGRWVEILVALAPLTHDHLTGRHQPCPKCGGTDRFRAFDDVNELGGVFCNQCFTSRNGDGFSTLQWVLGIEFIDAVRRVNEYLGFPGGRPSEQNGSSETRDPAKNLRFLEWDRLQAALFCRHKPPATVEALESCHASIAIYRGQFPVIALPIFSRPVSGRPDVTDSAIVGWAMLPMSGGTLPVYRKGQPPEWKKTKLAGGSKAGFIGQVDRLATAAHIWKVEGLSDLLALAAQPLPPDHAIITNAFGAKEDPAKLPSELLEALRGRHVYTVHDCDKPGQEGATTVPRDDGKQPRPGWAPILAGYANSSRNVRLPFPILPDHGHDLRDWLTAGGTFAQLHEMAEDTEPTAAQTAAVEIREADNDPHRLARVNLEKYRAKGRDLKYWRGEWYRWRGTHYRKMEEKEFRPKLSESIKEELNNCHLRDMENWRLKAQATDKPEAPPVAIKCGQSLITNVMGATAGMVQIPDSIEPNTWLPDRSRRNYISMSNGILDVDALLADDDNYLLPHSSDWFSTVSLPYAFEPEAACPRWMAFLNHNLEHDDERIRLLQEWAGYLLLPTTSRQKFLLMEGEGANGKSVYMAAITAMLGEENVSNVQLEVFGDRFSRTETIGKLVNVSGDCEELDKVAEGYLKSFTSGDRMFFDRKGIGGINCIPTARMMISCNERPKFRDRSKGIWRRMLLVPWRIEISNKMRVADMDKPDFWHRSGELSGIFWWAMQGLNRLREQNAFTESTISNVAKGDYQTEMNSARSFLTEFVEPGEGEVIRSTWLYKLYCEWAKAGNYKPFGSAVFGKEIMRVFPHSERVQRRERSFDGRMPRHYCYLHLKFSNDAIAGVSTLDNVELRDEEYSA